MTGQELFKKLSVRDYSGSPEDEYAAVLTMLQWNCMLNHEEEKFFDLLAKAHADGKKLKLQEPPEEILVDGYGLSDIILV